jgi:hypothetical protein
MRNLLTVVAILGVASFAMGEEATLHHSGFGAGPLNATGADFLWDDGTAETSVGVNNGTTGTTFGWANQFTNNTGGDITLANMEIAFGRPDLNTGTLAVGDAMDAVLWIDAGASNDMTNAVLAEQFAIPGGVGSIAGEFQTVAYPGGESPVIPNGAEFYVGAGDIATQNDSTIRFPASLDQGSDAGHSWAFFGPDVFDPVNLGGQTIGLIGPLSGGALAGNWLVRANIPEPATLSLLAIGGLALIRRRR